MAMMMLTSAASIAVVSITFIIYELVAARSEAHERLATLSRVVAGNTTASLAFRDERDATEVLATLRTEPHVVAAALYDERGALFARFPANAPSNMFPSGVGADGFAFIEGYLQGFQTVREVADHPLGTLFIRSDMRAIYQRFQLYGAMAVLAVLASLLLAYILSNLLERRLSGPILALTDTARAVSERGEFAVRAPPSEERELAVLTTAFNQMLEHIETQSSALRENEMRLRAVLNSALTAVIVVDARGRIADWNTTAERIFGWSRAEVLGAQLADLIIPERLRQAHQRGLERFLATGEQQILDRTLELPALRRDGKEFAAELSISVLQGNAEVSFCGFASDITEKKEARARAQAHLSRLDLLQRTTRAIAERQDLNSIYQVILRSLEADLPVDMACMCEYDVKSHALRTSHVGNRGAPFAQQLTLRADSRLLLDDATLARCVSGALVYEPDVTTPPFEFAQRLAAAGLRSLVIAPLVVEEAIVGVLLVARTGVDAFSSGDCEFLRQLSEHVALAAHQVQLRTALQQAYDDLRQSQQVILQQERLRALGQMASGVAHDINNAISPIALYTESLLEREPNLSERARDYLRIIQRAIEDVAQTVAKMREFYRRRDDAADLQPVELNPMVEQALQITRARWHDIPQERGVVIEVTTDLAGELPRVLGATSDIRDALTNLIFNAVDAMPKGGQLTLRTRRSVDLEGDEQSVMLEVTDTGIGMDDDTRRRCLEPFFTTKGERGTGMGLAMVYGMVKRHGAQIDIDSALGVGTTIRMRFRVATDAPAQHAPVSSVSVRPLRILIVDDDPLVLESLTATLASEGHTIEAADGGQVGIERLNAACDAHAPFDLVISDLGMPVVDGRAMAAAVKAKSPRTPVLLLTGWGERLQTEQTIPANVDRVLSKPPRVGELRRALAELTAEDGPAAARFQTTALERSGS